MTTGVPRSIEWVGGLDGFVRMIDQTRLPAELVMLECRDVETMWEAIRRLRVRGAPAIGVAAAMGVVLGARDCADAERAAFFVKLAEVCDYLATSRPTAVNLFWALERMQRVAGVTTHQNRPVFRAAPVRKRGAERSKTPRSTLPYGHGSVQKNPSNQACRCTRADERADVASIKLDLLDEAKHIRDEDAAMCRAIGELGESLIKPRCGILTHCNAGALATSEWGTALAPMYVAHERGRSFRVYAGETRPLLQGARLTAWELRRAGIDVTLLCDGMIGSLMQAGKVDLVITGADRIAANGDTANKIGTYSVAVLAREHGIPFYVAAPSSTFDLSSSEGTAIPIEQRDPDEIRRGFGRLTAPEDVPCYAPAFDVTPARLIEGILTERGLIQPVTAERIGATIAQPV